MSKVYVLYHANCYDGFTSAWAANKKLGSGAKYIPVKYHTPPPEMAPGSLVYIVDFSYPREVLLELAQVHNRVVVLDHHKSAQENLKGLEHPNLDIQFDMEKSGARLTWDHFHGNIDSAPWLVAFVSDRDLWRFTLPGSAEIHTVLQATSRDFSAWDAVHEALETEVGRAHLIATGSALVLFRDKQVDMTCQQARVMKLHNETVPVVNSTAFWSEVGHKLLELYPDSPFSVNWFWRADGMCQLSFRSRKDFDCSAVASSFGGGGHAQASGAEIGSSEWFEYLGTPVPGEVK
jgi:oligoribonuclease NrnB/cAMP/cGMP phosphodiesterase (DHH superfamily)